MTKYGYARVSTNQQELDAQKELLKNAGAEIILSEKISGARKDRPVFWELIDKVEVGDEIMVRDIFRFARSVSHGIEVAEGLLERQVTLNVLNMGIIDNSPTGRFIMHILFAVGGYQREQTRELSIEGRRYARLHKPGYKEGRPKRVITPAYRHAYELLQVKTYREVSLITGLSKRTLIRIKQQIEAE